MLEDKNFVTPTFIANIKANVLEPGYLNALVNFLQGLEYGVNVGFAPSFLQYGLFRILLDDAIPNIDFGVNSPLTIGVQNIYPEDKGAFTGETTGDVLRSVSYYEPEFIIIGHSERRELCGETSEMVAAKLRYILDNFTQAKIVLCVGEPETVREKDDHIKYVLAQLLASLGEVSVQDFARIIIAYQPVWDSGTGKAASSDQVQEMCGQIRKLLRKSYGEIIDMLCILYSGSIDERNVANLMEQPDVNGCLVDNTGLYYDTFSMLITKGVIAVYKKE